MAGTQLSLDCELGSDHSRETSMSPTMVCVYAESPTHSSRNRFILSNRLLFAEIITCY